jgi:excisionase family DNA binding protein
MNSPSLDPQVQALFEKLVLTYEDVATELNVSVSFVRKLVSEDKIPYAKVGRLVRFSRLRIQEWLQKGGNR